MLSGSVWPFVCIVIMCGALSGFHALIASGTTPKMVNKESDIRVIGYGGMLVEGLVSVTALIAACALEPGDYFQINTAKAKYDALVAEAKPENDIMLHPVQFDDLKQEAGIKEELAGRTAGGRDAGPGDGKNLGQPARHETADGLPLSFPHHVRGPLHPHAAGDGHPRGRALSWKKCGPPVRPHAAAGGAELVVEHRLQRGRLFPAGVTCCTRSTSPACGG